MGLMRDERRLENILQCVQMHYGPLGDCSADDSATNTSVCSLGSLNCGHTVIYACVCVVLVIYQRERMERVRKRPSSVIGVPHAGYS